MQTYFFDLDGTLTDSQSGLYSSFRSSVAALGLPPMDDRKLVRFLGTPLPEMFRTLKPGITPSGIEAGIKAFRTAYERDGIRQNRLYDGVLDFLREIKRMGGTSWVVTSKPETYAELIVQALDLGAYVSGVVGAGLDETDTKTELIARALELSGAERRDTVMVGDRHYDVEGALENYVHPIGVLWGYGSEEELRRAGCDDLAHTPREFLTEFVQGAMAEPGRGAARHH